MPDALTLIQNTYFSLDQNFHVLFIACQTQNQRDALTAQFEAARAAYDNTLNAVFDNNDAKITSLSVQLTTLKASVDQAVSQMGDMAQVLTTITSAVNLCTQLASMAT